MAGGNNEPPTLAGKGRSTLVDTIAAELCAAGDRDRVAAASRAEKKNYAEALSRGLAQRFADCLRSTFIGVLPDAQGRGQESRARTSKGVKKLDVNYSTPELGLGLGLSIKTINFRDARSGRYTKNYTRADGELRAEASDYHERQPWAVMIAVIFLPLDACDDGGSGSPSSFGKAVQLFRFRAKREKPDDAAMLFERVLIGLYDADPTNFGAISFFDVMDKPPRRGRPRSLLLFSELIAEIVKTYDTRNSPTFEWADAEAETMATPPVEPEEPDEES